MYKVSETPLVSKEAIKDRLEKLSEEINASGKYDILLGVLTGAYIYVADLSRLLKGIPKVAFVKASSYGDSTESSHNVSFQGLENLQLKGMRVLLIDDILDTGKTIFALLEELKKQGAEEIKTCVLLDKPSRREAAIKADFVGFTIENKFVVGYGLDYAGDYRTLDGIYTLEQK